MTDLYTRAVDAAKMARRKRYEAYCTLVTRSQRARLLSSASNYERIVRDAANWFIAHPTNGS